MGKTQTTERRPGVAFFGRPSLEADVKALEWACTHLRLSDKYKLRIIHVSNEPKNKNKTRMRRDSRYKHEDMEAELKKNYPDYRGIEKLQTKLYEVNEHICGGVTYEGENFEKALQLAIKEEELDTLVLACWVADDNNVKGPPINTLELEGCSIILAMVGSRKLNLSIKSTEVSAVTAAAPSSMPPVLTDESSNDDSHSTSSKANTQCLDGRETGTIATNESELTTPAAAAATNNPKRSTPAKRSEKASSSSGSKTDTWPRGREKTL